MFPFFPMEIPGPLSGKGESRWVMPSEAVSFLEVVGKVVLTLGIIRSYRTLWP